MKFTFNRFLSEIMAGRRETTVEIFFLLVRAGLWEKEARLIPYGVIDFNKILKLSEEQSVIGLVAAGIEHIVDVKPQRKDALRFIGDTLQIEQSNSAMNSFIGDIDKKMRKAGIFMVLVKGQGIARCYERPQWRSSGDIDYFLDEQNYQKAKEFLAPMASHVDEEDCFRLHQGMNIGPWVVELHGTMYTEISRRINKVLADVQADVFQKGGVSTWNNNGTDVFIPNPDNNSVIIFTHFISHFYVGGIGLRQICDWCRLLWKKRDLIDVSLLRQRLKKMGLMVEWKAFGAFAVEYLGMPCEAVPFYSADKRWKRKASLICRQIIQTGNFGHNKDASYRDKYPYLIQKCITFFLRIGEFLQLAVIFPGNAPKFFFTYVFRRVKATL